MAFSFPQSFEYQTRKKAGVSLVRDETHKTQDGMKQVVVKNIVMNLLVLLCFLQVYDLLVVLHAFMQVNRHNNHYSHA